MVETLNDIEARRRVVQELVESTFSPLKNMGYEYVGTSDDTTVVVKHVMESVFTNTKVDRKVVMTYEPIDVERKDVDFLSLEIYKLSSKREHIYVPEYLSQLEQVDANMEYLKYINRGKEGTFRQKASVSINLYWMYLMEFCKDILEGNAWHDGMGLEMTEDMWNVLYDKQKEIVYQSLGNRPEAKKPPGGRLKK